MHPSKLFDELKKKHDLGSDSAVADLIGLTPARVSQMRSRKTNLSARQVVSYLSKAEERGRKLAYQDPIRPLVEMYELEPVASKQDKKWELLPTSSSHPRNQAIRKRLATARGVYVFFDSVGRAIYVGKTEKQDIWKEMTSAYNRERSNHQAFFVVHPGTGTKFVPAYEKPRRPVKRVVYLYDTAAYFSAYEIAQPLIPKLEALLVRSFCNTLSNKKMENF